MNWELFGKVTIVAQLVVLISIAILALRDWVRS